MSDLVGTPEDRFSRVAAQFIHAFSKEPYFHSHLNHSSRFVIKRYFTELDSPQGLLSDPNLCIYDFICVFMMLSMKLKLSVYSSF